MGVPIASEFVTVVTSNKLLSWFFVLAFLLLDASASYFFEWDGAVGSLLTFVVNQFGIPVAHIASWQILFLTAIFPILMFAINKSG